MRVRATRLKRKWAAKATHSPKAYLAIQPKIKAQNPEGNYLWIRNNYRGIIWSGKYCWIREVKSWIIKGSWWLSKERV